MVIEHEASHDTDTAVRRVMHAALPPPHPPAADPPPLDDLEALTGGIPREQFTGLLRDPDNVIGFLELTRET